MASNPYGTVTVPHETRYVTSHKYPNCFVTVEEMKRLNADLDAKYALGASSTQLAEMFFNKQGISLKAAICTEFALEHGLIYTKPVPKRPYFIADGREAAMARRSGMGTALKDHFIHLLGVRPNLHQLQIGEDQYGFQTVALKDDNMVVVLDEDGISQAQVQGDFEMENMEHITQLSVAESENTGMLSSFRSYNPMEAIENCRRSVLLSGGTKYCLDRINKSVKNKGEFNYLYPFSRDEAREAAACTGVSFGTLWEDGIEIADRYLRLYEIARHVGQDIDVVHVNRHATMGIPFGVRALDNEEAEQRALGMAFYTSKAKKWTENATAEYLHLLMTNPTLVTSLAKIKTEVIDYMKFMEGGGRMILAIPQHLKILLQRIVQPFEKAKLNLTDVFINYDKEKWSRMHSMQKTSCTKAGIWTIIDSLDAQLKEEPFAYVTSGDDSVVIVRIVIDGKVYLIALEMDMKSFDQHQAAKQNEEIFNDLKARLARIDPNLAELVFAVRTQNSILINGMGVISINGMGLSGFPLQSLLNDVIMNAFIRRIRKILLAKSVVEVMGHTVIDIDVKGIKAICEEEARKIGMSLKNISHGVRYFHKKPVVSIEEQLRIKASKYSTVVDEEGVYKEVTIRDFSFPTYAQTGENEELTEWSDVPQVIVIAEVDDEEQPHDEACRTRYLSDMRRANFYKSEVMAAMNDGLMFMFCGMRMTVNFAADMPCLFDLKAPMDEDHKCKFDHLFANKAVGLTFTILKAQVGVYLDREFQIDDRHNPDYKELQVLLCCRYLTFRFMIASRGFMTNGDPIEENETFTVNRIAEIDDEVVEGIRNFKVKQGDFIMQTMRNGLQALVPTAMVDFARMAPNMCYPAKPHVVSDVKFNLGEVQRLVGHLLVMDPRAHSALYQHNLKLYTDAGNWAVWTLLRILKSDDYPVTFEVNVFMDDIGLDEVRTTLQLLKYLLDPRYLTMGIQMMKRYTTKERVMDRWKLKNPSGIIHNGNEVPLPDDEVPLIQTPTGDYGLRLFPKMRRTEPFDKQGHAILRRAGAANNQGYWHPRAPTSRWLKDATREDLISLGDRTRVLAEQYPDEDYNHFMPNNLFNRATMIHNPHLKSRQQVEAEFRGNPLLQNRPGGDGIRMDLQEAEELFNAGIQVSAQEESVEFQFQTMADQQKLVIEGGSVYNSEVRDNLTKMRATNLRNWGRPPPNVEVKKQPATALTTLLAQAKGVPGLPGTGSAKTKRTADRKKRQKAAKRGQVEAADLERDEIDDTWGDDNLEQ